MNPLQFWEQVRRKTLNIPKVNLNSSWMYEFDITLPTIEEQIKISNVLDQFEFYCNDITSGLPGEIEARHKQYEYYRNKLLTFERKEA